MRIVLTVLLTQALVLTLILHAISGTFWFSANWNPSPGDSGIERQRYVQSTRESGTVLIGVRSQPGMQAPIPKDALPPGDTAPGITLPRFKLSLEGPRSLPTASGGKPREGKPTQYFCGVSITTHDRPEQKFRAFYMKVRLWLVESLLALGLISTWVPNWIRSRQASKAANNERTLA